MSKLISYTMLSRFDKNPMRAYAHYKLHDATAYPQSGQTDAMQLGIYFHKIMAGEMTIDELPAETHLYKNSEKPLKRSYSDLNDYVSICKHVVSELNVGTLECEIEVFSDEAMGRFDAVNKNNGIIIDYKLMSTKNFDREWNGTNFGDWIKSTDYLTQAMLYMSLADFDIKHYYLICINKLNGGYRVYDLANIGYDIDLTERFYALVDKVNAYMGDDLKPAFINDGSPWSLNYILNSPVKVYEPPFL